MPKRVNPNLAKIHRSYTVEEVAELFGVHKNTVRQWIKVGLPVCDDQRPTLILGEHLKRFLRQKRGTHRRRCADDEFYCLRCRAPRPPAEGMVDYEAMTPATGRLVAICPHCSTMMNRYTGLAGLKRICTYFDVSLPRLLQHIADSRQTPLNSDFQ